MSDEALRAALSHLWVRSTPPLRSLSRAKEPVSAVNAYPMIERCMRHQQAWVAIPEQEAVQARGTEDVQGFGGPCLVPSDRGLEGYRPIAEPDPAAAW